MPVHFLDCGQRPATGAIAVRSVLEVGLEDRLEHDLGGGLDDPVADRWNAERPLAIPDAFGIITRRTGSGRYVLKTRSSRKPASHPSRPFVSILSNVIPSTPGAPALARASR
jgi:hypothetical protein